MGRQLTDQAKQEEAGRVSQGDQGHHRVIQATQNRSDRAVQTKLDELIRATGRARNRVIDLEEDDDEVVDRLREELRRRKKG